MENSSEVFQMTLLKMSAAGAVLILMIIVLRALARHHLPKRTFLFLWGVAVLRLLCPVSVPSVFSVYSWLPKAPSPEVMQTVPAARSVVMQAAPSVAAAEAEAGASASVSPWLILWAVGALLCAAVFLLTYVRCRMEFRTSVPVTHAFAGQWCGRHPLKRPLEIRELDRISTPLTYGILHPVILLPKTMDWTETEQLEYVLLHEYVHIRRFDTVKKLVLAVTVCLHWFNPLVWVMYVLYNRDVELLCDEQVVRLLGADARGAYARTLIDMEETKSGLRPLCSGFGKTAIEERIRAIMKMKKLSIGAILAAVLLVAGVTTVFATSAAPAEGSPAVAQEGGAVVEVPEEKGQAELLAEYALFGVTEKDGDLYYRGELIRWFLDGYEQEGNVISRYEAYNSKGTVDVHTVRKDTQNPDGSTELFGPITDIAAYSQEEFDQREFAYVTGEVTAVAEETEETARDSGDTVEVAATFEETSGDAEGMSFQEVFQRYGDVGIDYEEKPGESGRGNVYYQGKLVRDFADVSPAGTFTFQSADGGDISVQTVYDSDGKLIGAEECGTMTAEDVQAPQAQAEAVELPVNCGGCGRSDCEYCIANGLCPGYGANGDCGGCGRNDCETCIANGTCMGYGHNGGGMGYGHNGGGMGQGHRWGRNGG